MIETDISLIDKMLSEKNLSSLKMITDTPACIKVIKKDGTLLMMNPKGLDLVEADTADMAIGQNVYNLVIPEYRDKFIAMNEQVCSGKEAVLEFVIEGFKGTRRWMETYAVPFKTPDGELYHLAITHDISQRKNLENEVIQQKKNLVQSERMAALGEMSAGIAHEINNPLTIIMAMSRRVRLELENEKPDIEKMTKDLEKIDSTIHRIDKIIKGLKHFSRNASNDQIEQVTPKQIIEETLSFFEEKLKNNGVDLKVEVNVDKIIKCRPVEISQVILNLINNSFDAIKDDENKWIKIDVNEENNKLAIIITDSGKGISKEIQAQIMEPFFTTKDVGKGTGLGLSISHGIIEKHNGSFEYNSESANTSFKITLPFN